MAMLQKRLIFAAMGAAGLMALLSVLDIVMEIPFGRRLELDIPFLIAAALLLYMGWETYREIR